MDATWTPPRSSIELESGWWEAPDGSIYSNPAPRILTADEKREASEQRQDEAARRVRQEAALVPELIDRMHGFELQAYVAALFLAEALNVIAEEKAQVVFLDDVIAGLVLEIPGAVV